MQQLGLAINTLLDERAFAQLSGTVSLPFAACMHQQNAIEVIDPRGNDVIRLLKLGDCDE